MGGMGSGKKEIPVQQRIFKRMKIVNDCFVWTGSYRPSKNGARYGTIFVLGKLYGVHRVSMFLFNGNELKGSKDNIVDHICKNTLCFNPNHLRVVDVKTNALENSNGESAKNKSKTHCKNGHIYDGVYKGKYGNNRYCKTCNNARLRRKYAETHTDIRRQRRI